MFSLMVDPMGRLDGYKVSSKSNNTTFCGTEAETELIYGGNDKAE